jgi:TRAP-type C4-dicarboxylate transport system permease small subunit
MKLEKLINSGIPIICGVLLVIIVSVTFLQIFLRNFFNFGLPWYDEVSQFSMTWMVLIGTIWLTKNGQHLNTGLKLHQKLKAWQICLIEGVLALALAGIAAVVAYQTAIGTLSAMSTDSVSFKWLKMGYVYSIMPLAMLGVCYYYLKSFFKNLRFIFKKD